MLIIFISATAHLDGLLAPLTVEIMLPKLACPWREGDSTLIISYLENSIDLCPWHVSNLILDCKFIAASFDEVEYSSVWRSLNGTTHMNYVLLMRTCCPYITVCTHMNYIFLWFCCSCYKNYVFMSFCDLLGISTFKCVSARKSCGTN